MNYQRSGPFWRALSSNKSVQPRRSPKNDRSKIGEDSLTAKPNDDVFKLVHNDPNGNEEDYQPTKYVAQSVTSSCPIPTVDIYCM
uniref:Uncharacterized protein n=1 Tax=Ditylenchus dipsaci TaxID=166011 RepID=A0A915DN66_9BILA